MPDKIFLLPDEGRLKAAGVVASLIEAVPDDWSDMSGWLDSADPNAAWDTGYEFHRHGSGVRIVARRRFVPHDKIAEVVRPDPAALLIEGRSPGFISFEDTGYDSSQEFLSARSLAVGFVRRGYLGWLSINNGRRRKYADQMPVQVDFHLSPWRLLVDSGVPHRTMPPAVRLSWNEDCGGAPAQLESVHAICRRVLREWTSCLGDLGEAAYG